MPDYTPEELLDRLDVKVPKTSPNNVPAAATEVLSADETRALSATLRGLLADVALLKGEPATPTETVTITAVDPS